MENTVLITGAGFSMPYGYPSGETLVDRIKNYENGDERSEIKNLAKALKDSQINSIDNFLFEHQEFEKVGIELISREIFKSEKDTLAHKVKQDEDIINLTLNEVTENDFDKLKIVSFNYDRHFEWTLFNKFKQKYKDENKAMDAVKKLEIIHIHGKMIPFSEYEESDYNNETKVVPYGLKGINYDHHLFQKYLGMVLKYAQNSFKTVHTNKADISNRVIEIIKLARRVFFLGFGFDQKNMLRLGIGSPGVIYDWSSKLVSGTRKGIRPVKLNEINDTYPFLFDGELSNLYEVNAKELFEQQFNLTNSQYDVSLLKNRLIEKTCCQISAVQEVDHGNKGNVTEYTAPNLKCLECKSGLEIRFQREYASKTWNVVSLRKY